MPKLFTRLAGSTQLYQGFDFNGFARLRNYLPAGTYEVAIGEDAPDTITVDTGDVAVPTIFPGPLPSFANVGTVYDGETFAQITARFPPYFASVEGGEIIAAVWQPVSDGGDPVAAGDRISGAVPTWTSAFGEVLVGSTVLLDISVNAPIRIVITAQPTTAGLTGLTTATTGQAVIDAWTGRPVAEMSDGSELSTLYELRVDDALIDDLAALLPAGELTIATTFGGFGLTEPVSETVTTDPVTVTVAGGQAAIAGTPPDLPDPVIAGTPYFTQSGRVVPGVYPDVNGNPVTISDPRLRSGGIRVPFENRFNLIAIGEVIAPVETVSATGAQTIDIAGADRTAIAATITETVAPSFSALSVGMNEAAVKGAVNVGAANCNNGRQVAAEIIVTRNGGPFNGAILAGGDTVQISVKRTATGAADVTVTVGTTTIAGAQTGTNAASMSYDGAVATMSRTVPTGTYADGSPWASGGGTAIGFSAISPAYSASPSRTVSNGTTTTTPIHGTMVDPGKAPSGATLADRQLVNDGEERGAFLNDQGYDGYFAASNNPYNASGNVDPGKTGVALSLAEGTIVKAVSITSSVPANGRPTVEKLVPFTVVKSPPAVGAFRPGHADPSKVSWLTTAAMDMTKLPNIAAGALPVPAFAATYAAVKRFASWQHTYNVLSRNISPRADGAPVYGGDNYVYTEAMLGLCYDTWTLSQKTQMATALIQQAIDIAARAEQGGVWQDNAGHCAGPKSVVAFAAHLTGHQRFKDALGFTTTFAVWNGGVASVWGEDRQFFRISQADVNRAKPYPFTASQIGLAEWSSDPTRKDPADRENYLNSLGVLVPGDPDPDSYKQHYRHIIARVNVPGVLALRLMGAAGLMNSTFLDYQDRHMTAHFAAIAQGLAALPNGDNNKLRPFTIAAWQRDRSVAPLETGGTGTGGTGGGSTGGTGSGGNTAEPDAEIDYTTPAVGLFLSQSIIDYLFINDADKNKGPRPELLADNLTVYYSDKSYSAVESLKKIVLTRALLATYTTMTNGGGLNSPVSYTMIRMANALHRALPGKQFVIGDGCEAGSSQVSLVSDQVGWPTADKDRLWPFTQRLVDALYADFGVIHGLGHHWYAADIKYTANWKEVMFPVWFGIYENGNTFPMGATIPRAGTTGDHCIYDFKSSSPSDKGRGLLPRTVPFHMVKKGLWQKDTDATWTGIQEFVDSAEFKSLGGSYGHPLTGSVGGHPEPNLPDGPTYGQHEAMYETLFVFMLRCAGMKIIPPRFVDATTSSDGMKTEVTFYAPNGGNGLATAHKIRGGTRNTTAAIAQEIYGFEIERASGGGTYHICRPGSAGIDPKYQGTVTRLNASKVLIEWVQPIATSGDRLSFFRGHGLHRTDYPIKAPASDTGYLNIPLEDMPSLRGTGADFPFAGFMADTVSPKWSLLRGQTVGEGLPAGAVGGGTPPPTTAPVRTAQPVISGTAAQGQTLTATSDGSYTGNPTPTVTRQWRINGAAIPGATGTTYVVPAVVEGDVFTLTTVASNGVSPDATGTSNALTVAASGGGTPSDFGSVVQTAEAVDNSNGTFHQVSLSAAPTAGNLLIYQLAVDKSSGGTGAPTGFSRAGPDVVTAGVSAGMFYKIANGSEGTINGTSVTGSTSTMRVTEVKGPFAAAPLGVTGASTSGAVATSVSLSTGNTSQDDVYAHGFYANDSQSNGALPVSATNGFTVSANAFAGLGAQPFMITASKVINSTHNPMTAGVSTTISHSGTADESVGILAVFKKA